MQTIRICFSTARTLGRGAGILLFLRLLSILLQKKISGRTPRRIVICIQGTSYPFFVRDAADIATLKEVFVDKEYDAVSHIPTSIIDVGGHIGSATLFFANKYPQARIRTFEPDPQNYQVLLRNTAGLPQVTAYNLAVSDKEGTIDFYSSTSSISSSLYERPDTEKIQVETKTLDSILATPADLIKFDIEGAEYRMFSASNHATNVHSLIGELHYDLMGCDVTTFLNLFKDYTHALTPLGANRSIVILER